MPEPSPPGGSSAPSSTSPPAGSATRPQLLHGIEDPEVARRRAQVLAEEYRAHQSRQELLGMRRIFGGSLATSLLAESTSERIDSSLAEVQDLVDAGADREQLIRRYTGIVTHYEMYTTLGNPRLTADVIDGTWPRQALTTIATNLPGEQLSFVSAQQGISAHVLNGNEMSTSRLTAQRILRDNAVTAAAEHEAPTGTSLQIAIPPLANNTNLHHIRLHTAPASVIGLQSHRPTGYREMLIEADANATFVFGNQTRNASVSVNRDGMNPPRLRLPPGIAGPPTPQQAQAVFVMPLSMARDSLRVSAQSHASGDVVSITSPASQVSISLSSLDATARNINGILQIAIPQEGVDPSRWRHVDVRLMENGRTVASQAELTRRIQAAVQQLASPEQTPPTPARVTGQQR